MADVHDKKTRSYNMSRIRSGNTKPKMVVRRFLHGKGQLRDAEFLGWVIIYRMAFKWILSGMEKT